MKASRRPWTRTEKSLLLAPILIIIAVGTIKSGQKVVQRGNSVPVVLKTEPGNQLNSLRMSNDGRVLAATGTSRNGRRKNSTSGTIYLWDVRTLTPLPPIVTGGPNNQHFSFFTYGVAISPDSRHLGFSGYKNQFTVLDLKTRKEVWEAKLSAKYADFSPDGSRIAIAGEDQVAILDATNGKTLRSWRTSNYDKYLVLWSPNSQFLACVSDVKGRDDRGHAGRGGRIELRDRNGKKLREVGTDFTTSFSFSPNGQEMLCVGEIWKDRDTDNFVDTSSSADIVFVRCFRMATGTLEWEQNSETDSLPFQSYRDAIFSPDGKVVAIHAGRTHQILLLDVETGRQIRQLNIPPMQDTLNEMTHSLTFSADGKRIFVRGKDSVLMWDLNS